MVECVCRYCGASFWVKTVRDKRKYCSRECANKANGVMRQENLKHPKREEYKMLECKAELQGQYMDIKFNKHPSTATIAKLKELGFRYDWRYGSWRSTKNKERGKDVAEMACALSRKYESTRARTLCWSCQHSDMGNLSECPWAREFKPVDGWDAEPTKRRMTAWVVDGVYTVKFQDSYCVFDCPLYAEERRKKQ